MSARAIAVCLVVVTLPFTAIGVRVGAHAVGPLWEWFEMRRWSEVPAEVLSVDVDVHELNDGTLYRVRAQYPCLRRRGLRGQPGRSISTLVKSPVPAGRAGSRVRQEGLRRRFGRVGQ